MSSPRQGNKTVSQLKAELQQRGLTTSGRKQHLIDRLTLDELSLPALRTECKKVHSRARMSAWAHALQRGIDSEGSRLDLIKRLTGQVGRGESLVQWAALARVVVHVLVCEVGCVVCGVWCVVCGVWCVVFWVVCWFGCV
jgi:hypothetical protein